MRVQLFNYETPCTVEDLNRLQDDLINLSLGIQNVILVEDVLHVRSTNELTQIQKDTVDTVISSFIDQDLSLKVPLIMDIVKPEFKNKPFHGIKYTGIQELQHALIPDRESGTIKGEVQEVIWYRDMVETTPTTPVLKVNIQYHRDATSFAMFRTVDRTYYNRDGSENENVRNSIKYYFVNKQDMIDEGIKRRTLLVRSIQIPTMNLIAEVLMPLGVTMDNVVGKGRKFMDDYDVSFNNFKHNSSSITDPLDDDFGMKTIIVKLRDEQDAGHVDWLDKLPNSLGGSTSIRQHLIQEFSI